MKTTQPVRRLPLSPPRIFRAALALIDRGRVEDLSMRRLAADLKVDAMSIYHHVANKQALMTGIYETVLAELPLPSAAGRSWQDTLHELGKRFYRLARKYPKVFPHLISSHQPTAREVEIYHRLTEILIGAGLSDDDAARTTRAIYTYATGLALVAANTLCRRLLYQTGDRSAVAADLDRRTPPERDFDFSIELMVSGIEALVSRSSRSDSARRPARRARGRQKPA